MISDGVEKITVRSLTEDTYIGIPINYHGCLVDKRERRINQKSYRIMNRERKINSHPEE